MTSINATSFQMKVDEHQKLLESQKDQIIRRIFERTLESVPEQLRVARVQQIGPWFHLKFKFPKGVTLATLESLNISRRILISSFIAHCNQSSDLPKMRMRFQLHPIRMPLSHYAPPVLEMRDPESKGCCCVIS